MFERYKYKTIKMKKIITFCFVLLTINTVVNAQNFDFKFDS